jgi:hypothetical protein
MVARAVISFPSRKNWKFKIEVNEVDRWRKALPNALDGEARQVHENGEIYLKMFVDMRLEENHSMQNLNCI